MAGRGVNPLAAFERFPGNGVGAVQFRDGHDALMRDDHHRRVSGFVVGRGYNLVGLLLNKTTEAKKEL